MATEKTSSYLASIKEVSTTKDTFSSENKEEIKRINNEFQRAFKLALKKDYESALEIYYSLENEEMVLIIKKCMELEPIFEQFLTGQITFSQYNKSSKRFPDEVKEIVQYKYPDLRLIEVRNLENKFREKIEGIIDDLLSKNTLESLIEARKIYEKHVGVIRKPYNFDRLFLKTISYIPYKDFERLYFVEWTNVEKLINDFLLNEAKSFTKAEKIIKEIKVISRNRDTIQAVIRKYNKDLDAKLRQNYRETKLKQFVKEYKSHSFYSLEKNNKIVTVIEPFFLQRRIYAIYYLNDNYELFIEMLKANIDVMTHIPYLNQKSYYYAIIKSIKIMKDYSIFDFLPESIVQSENFTDVVQDMLEEDEETIRGIVKQLKGKDNQEFMESLFLKIFKKELAFIDTRKAPAFNEVNTEIFKKNYKDNEHVIHQTKIKRALFKTLAGFELILSVLMAVAIGAISIFAFKRELYFLGVILLVGGLILGFWLFSHLKEIILLQRERRLLSAKRIIENLEMENNIILKKIYLGLD